LHTHVRTPSLQRRLGFLCLPSAPPPIWPPLWPSGHGRAADRGLTRATFPSFWGFVPCRFSVCRGGAQVVVAASRAIMFPRLQPHLDGDVEKLVGVVWSLRILSSCGIFGSSRSFIGSLSYFFVSGMDVVFSTHSATSCPQLFRPTQG
jgi:hypothetical protein